MSKGLQLYTEGIFSAHRRSRKKVHPQSAIVEINGVKTKEDAAWYIGKFVLYYNRTLKNKEINKKVKIIRGVIKSTHGNSGAVKVKFIKNLPSFGLGSKVKVMLYPNYN